MATVTAEIGLLVYNLSPQSQTRHGRPRGEGEGRGKGKEEGGRKKTTSDKSVKARVKAAAENRMEEKGDRKKGGGREEKKTNNQQHADWTVTLKLKVC